MGGGCGPDKHERFIRLAARPCQACQASSFAAVVLRDDGQPLLVVFCTNCGHRVVRSAVRSELMASGFLGKP